MHCVARLQVPLRTFFALDQGLPTDVVAVRVGAANATDFGFIDVHMHPSELHRLRKTNFQALWGGQRRGQRALEWCRVEPPRAERPPVASGGALRPAEAQQAAGAP